MCLTNHAQQIILGLGQGQFIELKHHGIAAGIGHIMMP